MASDPIDLLAPSAVADPHKLFRELRHRGPMVWSERHCAWLIIGHPELEAAFRDPRLTTERMATFRSRISEERANALARAMELLDGWMLFHEPPLHTRLRAPIRREFTPNAVKVKAGSRLQAVLPLGFTAGEPAKITIRERR